MKEERHTRIVNGERHLWWTRKLWEATADLPVFDVAIDDIPETDINCWFSAKKPPTLRELAPHVERINAADLDYPVILLPDGGLMDGGHRIIKALCSGLSHVKAVKFDSAPPPDLVLAPGAALPDSP